MSGNSYDWWLEMKEELFDAVLLGMPAEAIAMLMRRAECAEHAATLFRLAKVGFESDVISGRAAREARYISGAIRDAVFERDGSKCRYCGDEDGPFHIDHVVPVVRGGKNTLDNLTVACAACNISKGARTLDEWTRR